VGIPYPERKQHFIDLPCHRRDSASSKRDSGRHKASPPPSPLKTRPKRISLPGSRACEGGALAAASPQSELEEVKRQLEELKRLQLQQEAVSREAEQGRAPPAA